MKKILLILLFISAGLTAQIRMVLISNSNLVEVPEGDEFYASSGDDTTGDGSYGNPWKTLSKASTESANWSAGDIIVFNGGDEFYGTLIVNSAADGASGNPIVIQSYGTGRAIFTGGETVNFTGGQVGSYWKKTMNPVYQVFESDVVLSQARLPKIVTDYTPQQNYFTITGFGSHTANTSTTFTSTDLQGVTSLIGATLQISYYDWRTKPYEVSAHNTTTGEVTVLNPSENTTQISVNDLFYAIDLPALLTQDDEWVYTGGDLRIYSTNEPTNITANTLNGNGITLDGNDFISIKNIKFKEFNGMGIHATNCDDLLVDNNEFYYNYLAGVFTTGSPAPGCLRTTVNNNYFKGSMENAININDNQTYSSTSDSQITNNTIFEHGLLKQATSAIYDIPHAIRLQSKDHVMTGNTLTKIGYNGVRAYGANTLIQNNLFIDYCLTVEDGGAIYCSGAGGSYTTPNAMVNSIFNKNIIIQTIDLGASWSDNSIYIDDGSGNVDVTDNSMSGGRASLFLHNNKDISVTGNTGYNARLQAVLLVEASQGEYQDEMRNNTLTGNEWYIDNSTAELVWLANFGATTNFNYGTYNNNKYWNPTTSNMCWKNLVGVETPASSINFATWKTLTGQDAASTEDGITVDDSQFVYNATDSSVNYSLTGTWEDLDANEYITTINLPAWSSKILVQPGSGPPASEKYVQDNAASTYTEVDNSTGSWTTTSTSIGTTDAEFTDGTHSLIITSTASGFASARWQFEGVASTSYTIKIWSKAGTGSTQIFRNWVNFTGFSNQSASGDSVWTEHTFNLTATATATCEIRAYSSDSGGNSGDILYIDKITIVEN